MKSARLRLTCAAALFLAWIGWLAYLAATTTHPIVLSRPQILMADLVVIADLTERNGRADPQVKVVAVPWAKSKQDRNLERFRIADFEVLDKDDGWQGPGRYLLPLKKTIVDGAARYAIAPIPDSPGFSSSALTGHSRIYPDSADARRQLENMREGQWTK